MKAFLRGKKPLKNLFILLVSFCLSALFAILSGILLIRADTIYTTHIFVNDADYGVVSGGENCNGTTVTNYTQTAEGAQPDKWNVMTFPDSAGALTACPATGYNFVKWQVNGSDVSTNTTIYKWQNFVEFDTTTNRIDIEAIFAPTYSVSIDADTGTASVANSSDFAITDNNSSLVTLAAHGTGVIANVTITPQGGYKVGSVTTTGGVVYNGDLAFNNSQSTFSLTLNSAGTVSVTYIGANSVTINAGAGVITATSGANYAITGSGTNTVIASSSSSNVSVPVAITPPGGYAIDDSNPVTATGYASYSNYSNNSFDVIIGNGEGTVTVNYVPTYVVSVIANNGSSSVTGNNISISNDNSDLVSITAVGNKTATVTVTPPNGYRINRTNPVTTTGSVSYSDFNASTNQFTLSMTDSGTATVNFIVDSPTLFNITSSNPTYGCVNISDGWCSPSTPSTVQTIGLDSSNQLDIAGWAILACEGSDGVFSHWELDGRTISTNSQLAKNAIVWPDDGNTHSLVAVFEYGVTVAVADSNEGSIRIESTTGFTANPNNQDSASVTVSTPNASQTFTVNVSPNSGYALRGNGITVSGNATYNNDLNNNTFTVTVTGPGTVTVDLVTSRTATFTVNDSTYGDLVYMGDSGWGWGDLNCSASSHVTSAVFGEIENNYQGNIETQIDLPRHNIYACAKEGATFVGWKINGAAVANPLNERNVINRNGYADGGTLKPLFVDNNNITVEAVFYYNVELEAVPSGAGDLQINNTSNYYFADPSNARSGTIMLYVDPSQSSVTTNSIMPRALSNDYSFVDFEYETGNVSYSSQTQSGHILAMGGPDHVKAIFASSHRVNYSTSDPNVMIVEPGTTKAKSYDSIGAYDDDPTGAGFVIDPTVASNYKLMYWQDENGVAVSIDEDFVPTGAQIRDGVTYTPVFDTTGNKRASVTVNVPTAGHLRYWSNSRGQWVDLATGAGLIVGVNGSDHFAGNTYAVADDPNYVFDHWDIITPSGDVIPFAGVTCTEQGVDQANCLDASQGTYGANQYYHVVAVFRTQTLNYESNPIPHTKGQTGTIYEPYTSNTKSHDPVINPTGAEARDTNSYYFTYWSDESGNIVSYDEIFVPSGGQIAAGATYYANFCNSNYTCILFTVNDGNMGYVMDAAHGDITNYTGAPPIEFDCDANGCSPHITIQAISRTPESYFFHHWEVSTDGENFSLLQAEGLTAAMNPSVSLPFTAGQRYIIKAIFTECETICFHDYSYGVAEPFDTETYGTTTDILDGDNNVIGSAAAAKTHNTNPYFAYWTTGCNGSESIGFVNEKIVSLDAEYYPDAETLATCSEFIAVFYRTAEVRMVVTTNYPNDSNARVEIRGDGETGRDAMNYVNLGVRWDGTGHPGLASISRSMEALAPPGYRFSHWTINGEPLENTDGEEILTASIRRSSANDSSSADIPWFTALSGQLNVLTAYFEPLPLPFTGAYTIWWIIGGGIGLVAIPSVILIINERKEQKKGGKK